MDKLIKRVSYLEKKRNVQFLIKDTILVSYPKSGRTWVRMMLTKLLVDMGISNKEFEMMLALHTQPKGLIRDFSDQARVIFLYRNIGDVVMSFFWESITSDRNGVMAHTSPSIFIKDKKFGLPNIAGFYNLWFNNAAHFKDHMFVRYEDLHNDTFNTMHNIVKFLSAKRVMPTWSYDHDKKIPYPGNPFESFSEEKLKNAIEYSRFENMKKIENDDGQENLLEHYKGNFGNKGVADVDAQANMMTRAHTSLREWLKEKGLDPHDLTKADQGRIRKGKINGYLEDLDLDDIAFVKEIESKINWPDTK